jgi:GNAT superfamily N-acetyltransferase
MAHHPPPLRPDGLIEVTVTHLEMLAPPASPPLAPPRDGLLLLRAEKPTVAFYRFLYNTVGEPWLWGDRRRMSDEALAAIVQHPAVEVTVLYVDGVPAGYFELDARVEGEVELAYFGLMPERVGQKLGPFLLDQAVRRAWERGPRRLWVHTCSLDHPAALPAYERAGFRPFKRENLVGEDPRALGLFPG